MLYILTVDNIFDCNLSKRLSSINNSWVLFIKSCSDFTQNQFFQLTIISSQKLSKQITGTQIDNDSSLTIQNESILDGNKKFLFLLNCL